MQEQEARRVRRRDRERGRRGAFFKGIINSLNALVLCTIMSLHMQKKGYLSICPVYGLFIHRQNIAILLNYNSIHSVLVSTNAWFVIQVRHTTKRIVRYKNI